MQKLFGALALVASFIANDVFAKEVVVYSSRKEHLVKPLFDRYEEKTAVKIRYITGDPGPLMSRIEVEAEKTPADILFTVDAGNLWQAANKDLLQPIKSPTLTKAVPAHLRDANNRWFGLSVRARTIIYNTKNVKPEDLSTYEALAAPEWKGRLCLRTSKKVYNKSLVAMMIARHGVEDAEKVVNGWVKNLAAAPYSNDTKAIEAVAAGVCDATIVNTYYFGRLLKKSADLPLAVYWPNQEKSGVHVNISGAGITKNAKNPEEAQALLEWLSSDEAQKLFASLNMEYPVTADVQPDAKVAAWGTFKQDPINVAKAGELQAQAVKLMDRAGYR
ncbi:MAG: extracellular solute-binding protein [Pseudomonadota bacterium]